MAASFMHSNVNVRASRSMSRSCRLPILAPLACVVIFSVGAQSEATTMAGGKASTAAPGPTAMTPLPRAYVDETLAIEGEDIKARKIDTRLSVAVRVNGSGPYQFIVDSGADTSVLGVGIARNLNLPPGRPVVLNGMTDRDTVDRVKVDRLALGSNTMRGLHLPVLKEDDIGAHGLIGIDALVNQRLMLDFDRRLVKVESAAKAPKPLPGEIVVVAKRRRGQLILTQVKAGKLPLDAVIDTGAELTVGNMLLREQLVRRRQQFEKVTATGVTGKSVELDVAWIPELQIGRLTIRDVPVAFADLPPFEVFNLANQPAMLLGTDILERFSRVSLDFRARKVRFQLRRCQPNALAVSLSFGAKETCQ
ncbi:hypothetical protein G7077_01270 [Sphingomonas piscis]|uniref:Peptidase A2 domain-containing protein n=1 Tax=Sphingomonas piscis TaxID=2714943 RepID=A0A6G7YLX6_9SPHN|nr:aspartyl protease family protein [Sphingomonas piscis]QIK77744.1 hypothetical protein G7077_01270 [Sphingomonas piscis]